MAVDAYSEWTKSVGYQERSSDGKLFTYKEMLCMSDLVSPFGRCCVVGMLPIYMVRWLGIPLVAIDAAE